MQKWGQIAHEAKDILTVCLAKSIDTALTAQLGDNWFFQFAQDDAREKVNNRITKIGQTSVRDLDLQALLKFLRYRASLSQQVLTYYGVFAGMDSFAFDAQWQQFCNLLDRLINDFRNRMEAHCRAADIEKELSGQEPNRIYGYQEAVQDMCKLAQIFETVGDVGGVSYYHQICALTAPKKKKWLLPVLLSVALAVAVFAATFLWQNGRANGDANEYRNDNAPYFVEDCVTVWPVHIYYKKDTLVAECYVINGTDQDISNVDIYSYKLLGSDGMLAGADFGILQDAEIESKGYIPWTFYFPNDTILIPNGDLTNAKVETLCRYE